jgi:NAD(P)H-hydrate epimerase
MGRPPRIRIENSNPARAIIARLGGIRALARLLGLPPTTIQGWHERGTIPARRQEDVLRAAERANVTLRPADFFAMVVEAEPAVAPVHALEILSVAEMGEADRLTIAAGTPGIVLMQAAGRAVADEVQRRFPTGPVVVLCGPGNNGGDGFVAARFLSESGRSVRVALLGERAALKGDAALAASAWNGSVLALSPDVLSDGVVVVDALFGAGLSRPLDGTALDVVRELNRRRLPVIAVDLPSGVNGDSGGVLGGADSAPNAVATVTFFRKKPAHLLVPSRELCGDTIVADIGIPDSVLASIRSRADENAPALWLERFPWPRLSSHKYSRGHAVVVGGAAMTGAGRLAARACQRAGAGLVTVAAHAEAIPIYAGNAGLLMMPVGHPADFAALLDDARKNAVLLGPGNGVTDETRACVLLTLEADRRCVLDADALTVFADRPQDLIAALTGAAERQGAAAAVLTPHDGEFARLFRRVDSVDLDGDKLARVRAAAAATGAVVLLKGADTTIAHPDGRVRINANAPATLATAGAGDVLAGLIVGLLAQGMDAFDAASAGAWIHGAAAEAFGPGLIAEDLPELVPGVLRELKNPA